MYNYSEIAKEHGRMNAFFVRFFRKSWNEELQEMQIERLGKEFSPRFAWIGRESFEN